MENITKYYIISFLCLNLLNLCSYQVVYLCKVQVADLCSLNTLNVKLWHCKSLGSVERKGLHVERKLQKVMINYFGTNAHVLQSVESNWIIRNECMEIIYLMVCQNGYLLEDEASSSFRKQQPSTSAAAQTTEDISSTEV